MAAPETQNAPAALERDEGSETYLAADLDPTVSPTPGDVADLLRCRPRPGDPAEQVAAWIARKVALLAAIERATG